MAILLEKTIGLGRTWTIHWHWGYRMFRQICFKCSDMFKPSITNQLGLIFWATPKTYGQLYDLPYSSGSLRRIQTASNAQLLWRNGHKWTIFFKDLWWFTYWKWWFSLIFQFRTMKWPKGNHSQPKNQARSSPCQGARCVFPSSVRQTGLPRHKSWNLASRIVY